MDNATVKQVYEIPKEEFDNFLASIDQRIEKLATALPQPTPAVVHKPTDKITLAEFRKAIGKGTTVVSAMVNGKHPSGFTLDSFRKKGTREVLTLRSEIARYFEGFGTRK